MITKEEQSRMWEIRKRIDYRYYDLSRPEKTFWPDMDFLFWLIDKLNISTVEKFLQEQEVEEQKQ